MFANICQCSNLFDQLLADFCPVQWPQEEKAARSLEDTWRPIIGDVLEDGMGETIERNGWWRVDEWGFNNHQGIWCTPTTVVSLQTMTSNDPDTLGDFWTTTVSYSIIADIWYIPFYSPAKHHMIVLKNPRWSVPSLPREIEHEMTFEPEVEVDGAPSAWET